MAKPRFTLTPSPTFKSRVLIPIPGKSPEPVEFTFKGRTRDEFKELLDSIKDKTDAEVIMEIASGWELEDAFDKKNLEELAQNYIGAPRAIIDKYMTELSQARLGN